MALRLLLVCLLLCVSAPSAVLAETASFDLTGPALQVKVAHDGVTLPVSEVPNLAEGDRLWIKADLPPSQSVHYLLIVAFLRGATNPPPTSWFHKADTWTRKGRDGLALVVPAGAQQVLIFLAPQTGGDFGTLMGAVRGRPGSFVRASQDLNQASLDRSRLDAFLAAVRERDPADPDRLKTVSPLLARSLTIKLNTDCFQKMPELQAACLMQGQDSLVLNDGHSTSIVEALTSGPASDLAFQASATPQAGFGFYSPYVGAAMDIARILNALGTAQYQYIPALPTDHGDRLALLLNTPPSFHNPMSVLVTALPAVEPPQAPPLQPVDPSEVYCAERSDLVLPLDGAPLAYSTHYAHDMVLRVKTKAGETLELPVRADAEKGGFIADTSGLSPASFDDTIDGTLHGYWGFEPFDGPRFRLQNARPAPWRLADEDQQELIVGRNDNVHLEGPESACVADVTLQEPSGATQAVDWKAAKPNELAVTLPLADAQPGPLTLLVKQYGMKTPDTIPLKAYAQAGHLEKFAFHAGDGFGVLKGARLDEVANLMLDGISFTPGDLASAGGGDELTMTAADTQAAAKLKAGQTGTAKVMLKDGRVVSLKVAVAAARPKIALIGASVQPEGETPPIAIRLTDSGELPQGSTLTFSVRAQAPTRFSSHAAIEVATTDGAATTTLTPQSGLTLEDPHIALATLDTGKAFGPSVFGPLQFRIVDDGVAGDWQPLGTLVRLPVLRELTCETGRERCQLSGSDLFLIDQVAGDHAFDRAVQVPEGFPGYVMPVPRPAHGRLYLKLHDDPGVINEVSIPGGD